MDKDQVDAFNRYEKEIARFGKQLTQLRVEAQGHQVAALLLARQCQDFSIGLWALRDTLTYSSRVTLLRGLFEASMRLNYVALNGKQGALNLEFSDLKMRLSKFDLAKKVYTQVGNSPLSKEESRRSELKSNGAKEVSFGAVLSCVVHPKETRDYWLYRHWIGIAHSELFELNEMPSKTCLISEVAEMYGDAKAMLERAGDCLASIFKTGSELHAA